MQAGWTGVDEHVGPKVLFPCCVTMKEKDGKHFCRCFQPS